MRIEKLDIKGFGKFQNRVFLPDAGLNVIYGSNEAGKSTLQAFIRAMLFGMKSRRREGMMSAIRRYRPWHQGYYGGILEYSLDDGQRFCVARNFDKNTVTLQDAFGKSIIAEFPAGRDEGPRFAEQHLGITESCFERTAFLGQMQSVLDAEGRRVVAEKLLNLRQSGDEEISVRRAIKVLREAQLSHVGSDRTAARPLNLLEARLAEAMRREQELTELHESRTNLFARMEQLKEEASALQAQLEETLRAKEAREAYDAYIHRSDLYSRLGRCLQEFVKTEQEAEKHQAAVEELTAELHALRAYGSISRQDCDEMSAHQVRWQILEKELEELRMNRSEAERKLAGVEKSLEQYPIFEKEAEAIEQALQDILSREAPQDRQLAEGRGQGLNRRGLLAGVPLVLLLMAADILWLKPFLPKGVNSALLILGVVLLVTIAVLPVVKPGRPSQSGRIENQVWQRWMQAVSVSNIKDFARLKSAYGSDRRMAEALKQELGALVRKETGVEGQLLETKEKILLLLRKGGFQETTEPAQDIMDAWKENLEDYNTLMPALKEAQAAYEACAEKARAILREASLIYGESIPDETSLRGIVERIKPVPEHTLETPLDLQTLQDRINALNEAMVQNRLEMNTTAARLENIPDTDALQQAHERVETLLAEKEELLFLGKAFDTAIEAINEASHEMSRLYAPALNQEMVNILKAVTKERYPDIKADSSLTMTLYPFDIAEPVLPEQLSSGTCDQIYFALRLAAVKAIEKNGERLPLFLDEPFSQYDEERTKNAMAFLASEPRQIFLFTCKKREVELAREMFAHRPLRVINLDEDP